VTEVVTGLSSMATRSLLADLGLAIERRHGIAVDFTSSGGVEVAQRVRAGARADLVVLAADVMDTLASDGLLLPSTLRPLFVSPVVAAVPAGATAPALATEDDARAAVANAGRIGYSTGPSGSAVLALLERWDLGQDLQDRLVQAPPGVPVAALLASGQADLGFQQLSELMQAPGVRVLGPLPGVAAISSTFSGAVLATSTRAKLAAKVLVLLSEGAVAATVTSHGMAVASPSAPNRRSSTFQGHPQNC
jgi:molybdate transport system substrate-binding protein